MWWNQKGGTINLTKNVEIWTRSGQLREKAVTNIGINTIMC